MAEQRYQTVLAVISDGLSVTQAAEKAGVSRQTVHAWLARYEAEGLDGLVDRSHRPVSCPHHGGHRWSCGRWISSVMGARVQHRPAAPVPDDVHPAQRFTASAPAAAPSTSTAAREHQR